jgi:hypothetical protein
LLLINFNFVVFVETQENGGQNLMSYMIMPVQRIPRYELLFKELKKHTDSSDQDFPVLNQVLELVHTIAITGFVVCLFIVCCLLFVCYFYIFVIIKLLYLT